MLFLFNGWAEAQIQLKFNAEGNFKIIQLTDMHISLQKGQSEVCYTLIREAIETEKPDLIVFAGHDHENDFIGEYYGIALGYGRVSAGKNAYGNLSPGMRVIVLTEEKREFETYIRLKGGEMISRCKYPDSFMKE